MSYPISILHKEQNAVLTTILFHYTTMNIVYFSLKNISVSFHILSSILKMSLSQKKKKNDSY